MFKRITAAALAAAVSLCLSACGGEAENTVVPETPPAETAQSTAPESTAPESTAPESTAPETGTAQGGTSLAETEDAGDEYLDRIIFLGDSTTYGLKAYGMLSGGTETQQVWTPSSGTLTLSNQSIATIVYPPTGEEIPIRDAVEAAKPDIMVITLGVNGVSFLTEDGFKSEYKALVNDIKEISPDTEIILQSIFPVESDYQYLADINNDKISTANGWIEDIAAETGVHYLDTYSRLVGADGFLVEEYGNGDGIHLGPAGFEIELENIRTHAIA